MPKDFYSILGVSKSASESEIKTAYRKLSKELHPDKHKGDKDKEAKFKEVNEAYEVLSDPQKKARYDQFGSADANPFGGGGGGAGFSGFEGFDASQFGEGFGDIFENFFGGARGGRSGSRRANNTSGRDIEIELTISLATAVSGEDREVSFQTQVSCPECNGSGGQKDAKIITCTECSGTGQIVKRVNSLFGVIQQAVVCPRCQGSGKIPEHPCKRCSGEGRVSERKTVKVHIPKGIDDGQALRLTGEGEAGKQGGKTGDLYVRIRVQPDPELAREQDDIHSQIQISALDAILGTDVSVRTVLGDVTLTIPAGTQPDQIMRIRGKGMPVLNASRHGDHYVTVKVEIPTKLSRKEKEILEQWRKVK